METAGLPGNSPTFSQDCRIHLDIGHQINLPENEMTSDYHVKHGKV